MRDFFKQVIVFLMPFAVLVLLFECSLRMILTPRYFDAIEVELRNNKKVDYLFLGASRTATSVNPEIFSSYLQEKEGKPVNTLNIARGGLTVAEYYLGLKKIFHNYPRKLNGAKIFIEAYGQVLEPDQWTKNSWGNPNARGSLVDVLMTEDLPGLLRSNTPDKYIVTAEFFIPLEAYRKKWYIRDFMIKWRLENILNKLLGKNDTGSKKISDKGGVRTDKEGIALTRKLVLEETKQRIHKKLSGWETSILQDLVVIAEKNQCEIIFFQAAESSLYHESYKDSVHQLNQQAFRKFLDKNSKRLVVPPCRFPDEDFPDLSHLADDMAPEFTRCLANTYLAKPHF